MDRVVGVPNHPSNHHNEVGSLLYYLLAVTDEPSFLLHQERTWKTATTATPSPLLRLAGGLSIAPLLHGTTSDLRDTSVLQTTTGSCALSGCLCLAVA